MDRTARQTKSDVNPEDIERLIRQLAERGFYVLGALPRERDTPDLAAEARMQSKLKH